MQLARGALGIAVILGLCFLLSRNRRAVSGRVVLCGLALGSGLIFGLTAAFGRGYWVPLVEPVAAIALA